MQYSVNTKWPTPFYTF